MEYRVLRRRGRQPELVGCLAAIEGAQDAAGDAMADDDTAVAVGLVDLVDEARNPAGDILGALAAGRGQQPAGRSDDAGRQGLDLMMMQPFPVADMQFHDPRLELD